MENRDKGCNPWLPSIGNSQQARFGCTPLLAPVVTRARRLGNIREGIFVPRLLTSWEKREQGVGRLVGYSIHEVLCSLPVLYNLDVRCTSGIWHLGNGGRRIQSLVILQYIASLRPQLRKK